MGKNPRCDFRLDHPSVLDQHAQIFFSQSQYWVKDLTGQRSILVNRQPISLQAPLKLNDSLALTSQGPIFRFIGEGRLIEVAEQPAEGPAVTPGKKEEVKQRLPEDKVPPKRSSFFKKLFND